MGSDGHWAGADTSHQNHRTHISERAAAAGLMGCVARLVDVVAGLVGDHVVGDGRLVGVRPLRCLRRVVGMALRMQRGHKGVVDIRRALRNG